MEYLMDAAAFDVAGDHREKSQLTIRHLPFERTLEDSGLQQAVLSMVRFGV